MGTETDPNCTVSKDSCTLGANTPMMTPMIIASKIHTTRKRSRNPKRRIKAIAANK